jgi:Uma2 family endonuclease
MLERRPRSFSVEEYLALEEIALAKSEFCEGAIYSMSGGSIAHNRLARNLLSGFDATLQDRPCEPFGSDLRLHVARENLFTYPDMFVICGQAQLYPGRQDTVTDATLIIEVLSPSTEAYDREGKFRLYRSLPSFAEYVLVSQNEVRLEQHRRQRPGQWLMTEHTAIDDEVSFTSVGVTLALASIYRGVI